MIQFLGHMLLMILMVKKLLEHFMKKNCRKQIKRNLGLKKKREGNKLYVKWKGYDNLYNIWIDNKEIYELVNIFQNQTL